MGMRGLKRAGASETALDTNILSSLWSNEPTAPNIQVHLNRARHEGPLLIGPIVYAEALAHPTLAIDRFHEFLENTKIQASFDMQDDVWTNADLRYRSYAARRRMPSGEEPRRMLADFLVGAHALRYADRLMTLDTARYKQDFPTLLLYPL